MNAATNVRLRLTVKRNTVQKVAARREPSGECLQNAGSPDGLRRFRYFTGRSSNGIAVKRKHRRRHRLESISLELRNVERARSPRSWSAGLSPADL